MRINVLLPAAAALLLAGSNGFAAAHGPNEFAIAGSWTNTKVSGGGDTESEYTVSGYWGRYVNHSFEVGPFLSVTKHEGVDAVGRAGAFVDWNFGGEEAMTVPFLEALGGFGFGFKNSYGDNPVTVGGKLGIKHFLGENGAVLLDVFVNHDFFSEDQTGFSGVTYYGLEVGIALFK